MYKLDLEKAEKQEIKLKQPLDHTQSKEISEKNIYFFIFDYTNNLTVWITTNCGAFLKRWECQTTLPVS